MLTTNIFTPDQDSETEDYFKEKMPIFFTLLALFAVCHFLYEFDENITTLIIRVVAILIIFLTGISRRIWMVYVVCIIWILLLFVKGGMIST
jgi:cell division protein FtsW (lipid II flippase)